eukprot:jgi/Mesvir1/26288/Mv01649-RA.1
MPEVLPEIRIQEIAKDPAAYFEGAVEADREKVAVAVTIAEKEPGISRQRGETPKRETEAQREPFPVEEEIFQEAPREKAPTDREGLAAVVSIGTKEQDLPLDGGVTSRQQTEGEAELAPVVSVGAKEEQPSQPQEEAPEQPSGGEGEQLSPEQAGILPTSELDQLAEEHLEAIDEGRAESEGMKPLPVARESIERTAEGFLEPVAQEEGLSFEGAGTEAKEPMGKEGTGQAAWEQREEGKRMGQETTGQGEPWGPSQPSGQERAGRGAEDLKKYARAAEEGIKQALGVEQLAAPPKELADQPPAKVARGEEGEGEAISQQMAQPEGVATQPTQGQVAAAEPMPVDMSQQEGRRLGQQQGGEARAGGEAAEGMGKEEAERAVEEIQQTGTGFEAVFENTSQQMGEHPMGEAERAGDQTTKGQVAHGGGLEVESKQEGWVGEDQEAVSQQMAQPEGAATKPTQGVPAAMPGGEKMAQPDVDTARPQAAVSQQMAEVEGAAAQPTEGVPATQPSMEETKPTAGGGLKELLASPQMAHPQGAATQPTQGQAAAVEPTRVDMSKVGAGEATEGMIKEEAERATEEIQQTGTGFEAAFEKASQQMGEQPMGEAEGAGAQTQTQGAVGGESPQEAAAVGASAQRRVKVDSEAVRAHEGISQQMGEVSGAATQPTQGVPAVAPDTQKLTPQDVENERAREGISQQMVQAEGAAAQPTQGRTAAEVSGEEMQAGRAEAQEAAAPERPAAEEGQRQMEQAGAVVDEQAAPQAAEMARFEGKEQTEGKEEEGWRKAKQEVLLGPGPVQAPELPADVEAAQRMESREGEEETRRRAVEQGMRVLAQNETVKEVALQVGMRQLARDEALLASALDVGITQQQEEETARVEAEREESDEEDVASYIRLQDNAPAEAVEQARHMLVLEAEDVSPEDWAERMKAFKLKWCQLNKEHLERKKKIFEDVVHDLKDALSRGDDAGNRAAITSALERNNERVETLHRMIRAATEA